MIEGIKKTALEWWNKFTDKEKLDLSLKHYKVLDLNIDQIVFVWRRTTGGEWKKIHDPQLNVAVVMCSACGELIPDHEKYPEMSQMDADDIECISCEMKYRDSADLDNYFGVS